MARCKTCKGKFRIVVSSGHGPVTTNHYEDCPECRPHKDGHNHPLRCGFRWGSVIRDTKMHCAMHRNHKQESHSALPPTLWDPDFAIRFGDLCEVCID